MAKKKKPVIESVEFCYEGSGKQLEAFTLSAVKDYVQARERNEAKTDGKSVTSSVSSNGPEASGT